jgi:type VI secretion system secreted protein VgrG
VQYRESDYNFIARLLEHEGIYWYFEHTEAGHQLILVDSQSAHDAAPGCTSLPYLKVGSSAAFEQEYISDWSFAREIKSGKLAATSYDFERPSTSLKVQTVEARSHELSDYEIFDFQGDYTRVVDGTQLTDNRLDEQYTDYEVLRGTSNASGIRTGHLLQMTRHPREDQNSEFLITSELINAQLATGQTEGTQQGLRCNFSAIPSNQQFRPPRRTPKPFVQGPQTAVVVGPSNEEIFTDNYGRVKVQFHWDRYGKKDGSSSCWTRVSSPWAGKNFGFIQVPRIGQEVVVDFLEGDPDQPIITGRVYNAQQMPPWELPAHATQSGIHTRSSKDGTYGNANTLMFEDKKGAENVLLHAEKNMAISVEADQGVSVGHNQSTGVKNEQTTVVHHARKVFVLADGETYSVVGPKRSIYVDAIQEQVVTKDSGSWVQGNMAEYVTGDRKAVTDGKVQFKSTEAYFNTGPQYFLTSADIQLRSDAKTTIQAGSDFVMRAADFKISATGNINFTANKFNRTIFQGNDTVLGSNTNTYIGSSRDTTMGPSVEVYSGMKNSTAAGIAVDGFLGMQVSNFVGLTMSNAVALSINNAAINMGMTAVDLSLNGISLDNNAIKLYSAGGAAGPGAAVMFSTGPGIAALLGAAAGLGFAAGFGGAAAIDAQSQADADIQALLDNRELTDAVKARLRNAMAQRFRHSKAENSDGTINDGTDPLAAEQTAALAGPPLQNNPNAEVSAPAAPGAPALPPGAPRRCDSGRPLKPRCKSSSHSRWACPRVAWSTADALAWP